jgi:heme/copper-type cytochrome/quinol oxidase subunit 2
MTMRVHDRRQVYIAVITVILIIAAIVIPLPVAAFIPQTREVTVDARAFAYAPASIEIHQGDTVHLTLQALDAAHGLSIDGYNVNIQAEPGKSAQASFVADKQGKFKFRCSVSCGPLHPFMIGEMHVDPEFPLARALAATLITTIGALVFFWRGA